GVAGLLERADHIPTGAQLRASRARQRSCGRRRERGAHLSGGAAYEHIGPGELVHELVEADHVLNRDLERAEGSAVRAAQADRRARHVERRRIGIEQYPCATQDPDLYDVVDQLFACGELGRRKVAGFKRRDQTPVTCDPAQVGVYDGPSGHGWPARRRPGWGSSERPRAPRPVWMRDWRRTTATRSNRARRRARPW